jgi:putative FmdB family regulatory protein
MPTYEYQCDRCGFRLEKFQTMSAKAIKKCPKCGHKALRRLIGTGAGIIFKGSGFYETDYRPESYKAAAKADSAPAPSDSKPDGKATDAKPSTKEAGKGEAKADGKVGGKSEAKPAAEPTSASKSASKSGRSSNKSSDKK